MKEEGKLDFSMMSDMDLVFMRKETKDDPDFRKAIDLELSERAKSKVSKVEDKDHAD